MPATIGIRAASATSFSIEPSNAPMTREAMNAVTRLIASHAHRFFTDSHTGANTSSVSRRPPFASASLSLFWRMKSTTASTVTRPTSLPAWSITAADTRS